MQTKVTKQAAVIVGSLSLLLAAACGGSSHEPPPTAKITPTHATPRTAPGASPSEAATSSAKPKADPPAAAAPAAAAPEARTWWHPGAIGPNAGPEFQWLLDHALNVQGAGDMGDAATNAAGQEAPKPTVYDIDGIDNPAATVGVLHRLHDKAICYVEIGAAGDYYSAALENIPVTYFAQLKAAGELGSTVPGYPSEHYLNINAGATVRIIESMIRQQCFAKGFDAVEPDIDDSYTDATSFKITEGENISYDKILGAYAHQLGLAWGQKNGDNDPQFAAALEPTTDFLLDEECNFFHSCEIVTSPYVKAGKMVLNAEYTDDWGSDTAKDLAQFCAFDVSHGIDGTLFTTALAGQRNPCR